MRRTVTLTLTILSVAAVAARAQSPPRGGVAAAGGMGAPYGNPYANPALNPFLNPYLTQATVGRNDAMLYFWAAQSQPGGVLGPRPTAPPAATRRAPAEMPRSAATPGGGAARYFGRGPGGRGSLDSYYQRHNRYFSDNGH